MNTALRLIPLLAVAPAFAQQIDVDSEAPISQLLQALPEDVRTYHDHVSFLAHPFLEGRLPGTRGMEIAKDYCEQHFIDMGLAPVFESGASYRQPFSLGARTRLVSSHLSVAGEAFNHGHEFSVTGMGKGAALEGPVVFCGYGIEKGSDGYRGFPEDTDLSGKVALIFRFEPMDEEGVSLWARRPPWSTKAGFSRKLRDLEDLGAKAVIIANPPGADDPRINDLMEVGASGRSYVDIPVLMVLPGTAQRMLDLGGARAGLMDLRREADAAGVVRDLGFDVRLEAGLEQEDLLAENVIAMLPGKGRLAEEIVVLGAHLDHLGQGNFGSREGAGKLHPGADDNASGSAAVIMIAERLAEDYAAMPEGSDARTILFMLFSAEESGLIGSAYYTNNPAFPIERHKLMVNFDMIGRIADKRLSLSGAKTGEGLADFLEPMIEETPLTIVQPENMSGASDHTPFYRAGMPVLFSIIADFHDDYHTSRDTIDKINRVDAVHAIDLFHRIVGGAATHPEGFAYVAPQARGSRGSARAPRASASEAEAGPAPVSLGVRASDAVEGGVGVMSVSAGSTAAEAGLEVGDRLIKWNSSKLADRDGLKALLDKSTPGEKVQVTVVRDGAEKVFWMTLKGR